MPKKPSLENDVKFNATFAQPITCLTTGVIGSGPSADEMVLSTNMDGSATLFRMGTQHSLMTVNAPCSQYCGTLSEGGSDQAMFFAGADGSVHRASVSSCSGGAFSSGTGGSSVIGKHNEAVRSMTYSTFQNLGLVTAGLDNTMNVWDVRAPRAALVVPLPAACEAMDAKENKAVIATEDGFISVYNFTAGCMEHKGKSPLNYRAQCCSLFASGSAKPGFCIGSVEGRCCVEYFEHIFNQGNKENFMFRCHREGEAVHSVNALQFHQANSLFTVGSDGIICFWDKDARTRLKLYETHKKVSMATAGAFTKSGKGFVYALTPNPDLPLPGGGAGEGGSGTGSTGGVGSASTGASNQRQSVIYAHQMVPEEVKKGFAWSSLG